MLISGKIIFFSEGLLFIHSQYGSITLPKDHISSIKFYDPVIFTLPCDMTNTSPSLIESHIFFSTQALFCYYFIHE